MEDKKKEKTNPAQLRAVRAYQEKNRDVINRKQREYYARKREEICKRNLERYHATKTTTRGRGRPRKLRIDEPVVAPAPSVAPSIDGVIEQLRSATDTLTTLATLLRSTSAIPSAA